MKVVRTFLSAQHLFSTVHVHALPIQKPCPIILAYFTLVARLEMTPAIALGPEGSGTIGDAAREQPQVVVSLHMLCESVR